MEVKTITVKNNKETFEKEIKKYLEQNYKIINSNLIVIRPQKDIVFETVQTEFYLYALLVKE